MVVKSPRRIWSQVACFGTIYSKERETRRLATRRWDREHPERKRELRRQYYWRNKDRIRPQRKENNHRYNLQMKLKVFEHYAGTPPSCACCGESHLDFLSLDHINGGGAEQRRRLHGTTNVYRWIIKNGFPAGLQVLCMNCNFAKGKFGRCPHTISPN